MPYKFIMLQKKSSIFFDAWFSLSFYKKKSKFFNLLITILRFKFLISGFYICLIYNFTALFYIILILIFKILKSKFIYL